MLLKRVDDNDVSANEGSKVEAHHIKAEICHDDRTESSESAHILRT